jgi:hypothetical protein
MSRRFGRKHRRHQLALINLQQSTNRALRFQLDDEIASVNEIREQLGVLWARILDWDEDIRSQLGRYSAWLIETGELNGEGPRQLQVYEPLPMPPLDFSATFSLKDVSLMFQRMHYFRVELSRIDPTYLRQLLRVRLTESAEIPPADPKKPAQHYDSEARYGISRDMLRNGLSVRDITEIATAAARLLVDQLNERHMR